MMGRRELRPCLLGWTRIQVSEAELMTPGLPSSMSIELDSEIMLNA